MRQISCELLTQSAPPHLQQIFTGFTNLAQAGIVDVSERFVRGPAARDWTLTVRAHGRTIVYDVHDSHIVDPVLLDAADYYFKRSFQPAYVATLGSHATRVHPLGLNYEVLPDHLDFAGARRNWHLRRGHRRFSGVISALHLSPRFTPRQHVFENGMRSHQGGRALFLTRAWDPHDAPEREQHGIDQREAINEMRARCIARLRDDLGDRVLAGFAHSEFAMRCYPDLLVPDPSLCDKRRYLAAVRQADVCVTTTGVHGSVGWKLGEYVALGKAIVSERIAHRLPGNFRAGTHYLDFSSDEACVAAVHALLSDPARRRAMAAANRAYYQQHLRPDQLVLNTLRTALQNDAEISCEDVVALAAPQA